MVAVYDWPKKDELPIDEVTIGGHWSNHDNNNFPIRDTVFSFDHPGLKRLAESTLRFQLRANFKEFVRIGFSGEELIGNSIQGTRVSEKMKWYSSLDLVPGGPIDGGWMREMDGNKLTFPAVQNTIRHGVHIDKTEILKLDEHDD